MTSGLLIPELRGCRGLFLRQLEVMASIGVHAFEQGAPQRLLIDIELFVSLADSTSTADDVAEIVDYDFIRETVLERVGRGHINLQETLCDDLLSSMLAHPRVVAARVATQKPDVYLDCAGVGVEVFGFASEARA